MPLIVSPNQSPDQTLSKFLSKLWLNEKTLSYTGDQKKAEFLKVINKLTTYKFFNTGDEKKKSNFSR